ncbi:MAG: hypothetical protein KAJ55_09025 [Anaerolineales bacterium]|nr:hypothetical protein [Anaerolineales bacterium]
MTDTLPATIDDDLELAHLSATICAELAAGLANAEGVREKYEISEAQWAKLKVNKAFRNMLKDAVTEWSGDLNAGKRITKKAEIVLEDSINVLYQIAQDDEKPSQQRIDSIKQMAALAGRNAREAAGAGVGSGHAVINIHIDTGEAAPTTVTIEGETIPEAAAA